MNRRDLFRLALASPAAFLVGKYGVPGGARTIKYTAGNIDRLTAELHDLLNEWVREGYLAPNWEAELREFEAKIEVRL